MIQKRRTAARLLRRKVGATLGAAKSAGIVSERNTRSDALPGEIPAGPGPPSLTNAGVFSECCLRFCPVLVPLREAAQACRQRR